jgi:transposase InsO family protein
MSFWKPTKTKKRESRPPDTGKATPAKKKSHRSPPIAFEAKILAIEAVNSGADQQDISDVLGIKPTTITKWMKIHRDEGLSGLCRKPSSIAVRKQCTELEKRIIAHRSEHPDHGVRRIRDDLRHKEGLDVSAEKVRQTVNAAGVGNPSPRSHKRPPQVRRFERPTPNAMWQIDIFTFNLKRMYKVYLIGIIDDHSRYLVGWGLYRQQTSEAVMEVVKGAIGQWGAPREILSDNGRQFVAWKGKTQFQKTLKQQGIQHVRSAPRHPMTLGKIERFWQTIWREFLEEAVFASFADACQRLDHWVSYYNHQRPHQGIDGACPADRFYGMAKDVEAAVKQGCQENSLRLALGQEPQPPLYLLGQLGGVDVRVVRKGDDIEVKVGEAVHEVIHLAAPYEIGEDGHAFRDAEHVEVEGSGRAAEIRGCGAGPQTGDADPGVVSGVRHQSADLVPGHGSGGQGGNRCVESEAERPASGAAIGERDPGSSEPEQGTGEGPEAAEVEEPGSSSTIGSAAEGGPGAETPGRKKNQSEVRDVARDWPWLPKGAWKDGPHR